MKTVLITGASSGIGRATAVRLAREDVQLVLTARNLSSLEEVREVCEKEGRDVIVHALDVRDRAAVEEFSAALIHQGLEVDVLVNNAGLAVGMDEVKDGNPDDWDQMIDTNIKGLLYMTRAILPGMVARDRGHIVNIGSIAGTNAYARGAVYCATKAAVRFISDALRQEVVASGIRVTNIQPGMVETNFSRVRLKGDDAKAEKVYEGIEALSGEDVAEVIAYAILAPENVQISELTVMPMHQAGPGSVHRKG